MSAGTQVCPRKKERNKQKTWTAFLIPRPGNNKCSKLFKCSYSVCISPACSTQPSPAGAVEAVSIFRLRVVSACSRASFLPVSQRKWWCSTSACLIPGSSPPLPTSLPSPPLRGLRCFNRLPLCSLCFLPTSLWDWMVIQLRNSPVPASTATARLESRVN